MKYNRFFKKCKNIINFHKKNKVNLLIVTILIHLLLTFSINVNDNNNEKFKYQEDDLTIVSAYYKIKSKYKPRVYLNWIINFVMINKSMVIFTNKKFMLHLKSLRPKEIYNKTVFIEVEMEQFYSYFVYIEL